MGRTLLPSVLRPQPVWPYWAIDRKLGYSSEFCKEIFEKVAKPLFTLLKTDFKLDILGLAKYVCHRLQICASKASEIFSNKVDFF